MRNNTYHGVQTLNTVRSNTKNKQIIIAAYTGAADDVQIEKALPCLSMLIAQNSAYIADDRILLTKNAASIANMAKKHRAMPILAIECTNEYGSINSQCLKNILNSPNKTEHFINEVINSAIKNNYSGVEINCCGLEESDKYKFTEMFMALSGMCKDSNLYCQSPIVPIEALCTSDINNADISDIVPLWNYIWDDIDNQSPAAPLSEIIPLLNSNKLIPYYDKLLLGIPTFGVNYIRKHKATEKHIVSAAEALKRSQSDSLTTEIDKNTKTPIIRYKDAFDHTVHFEDAASIFEKLELIDKYNLAGINIMSIEYDMPVLWQIICQRYDPFKF